MDDFKTLPKMVGWSEDNTVKAEVIYTLSDIKPNHKFIFHPPGVGHTGPAIGSLDFNGPEMKFEGNADESAKVFFEYVAKYFHERLREEYQRGYNDAKKENT